MLTPASRIRCRGRLHAAGTLPAVAALLLLTAPPAAADTVIAQSSAAALTVSTLSTPLLPGLTATNTGSPPTVTATSSGAIPLLPGVSLTNTGAYSQAAMATSSGTSAACAGVVGTGGTLRVGQDGSCTPTNTTGPAVINLPSVTVLGIGYTLTLTASAIYGVCSAGYAGGPTAASTLSNVVLTVTPVVLGLPGTPITIPINASQPVSIPAPLNQVISIGVNQTSISATTSSVTALHIGLGPSSSLLSLDIGQVSCGPNAPSSPPH